MRLGLQTLATVLYCSVLSAQSPGFQYLYDDRNQLAKVVDSTGIVIEYVYDPVGNILRVNRSTLIGAPGALNIFSFTPQQGGAGTVVTLQGQAFSPTLSANVVRFNGVAATVLSATANTLRVVVPQGATSGAVTVTVGAATATAAPSYSIVTVPLITSISPNGAPPGATIATFTVNGVNLSGATFSFAPQFSPATTIGNVSINAGGTSATMRVVLSANVAGTLVLNATIAAGSSDPFPSAANSFRVLNPFGDEDKDGLLNGEEATRGTDLFNPDTDGDGYIDGVEVEAGSDPRNPNSTPASINPFREAVTRTFSMLNTGDPGTLTGANADPNNSFREASTPWFSMLNTGDPGTLTGANADPNNSFREASTPWFSMLNTGDPGTATGTIDAYKEALGLLFSMQNLAIANTNRVIPPNAGAGVLSGRASPGPTAGILPSLRLIQPAEAIQPVDSSTLYEGQTITIRAGAENAISIGRLDLFINGVPFSSEPAPPWEKAFTVPAGIEKLTFNAVTTDASGNRLFMPPVTVRVTPDPLTLVEGRVLGVDGLPAPRTEVVLEPGGVQAGFYPFVPNVTLGNELPAEPPRVTKLVSSINMRNPKGVFGPDPFGSGLGPNYIVRLRGQLWVREAGRYEFILGADSAARLAVNGVTLIERDAAGVEFAERTGAVELRPGFVPIEIIQFRGQGHGELQLSYTPPGGVRQVITSDSLLAGALGAPSSSDASGFFTFRDVPRIADAVRVRARTMNNSQPWIGLSPRVLLVPKSGTNVGTISLIQGELP